MDQCKDPADFVKRIVERWGGGTPKVEMVTEQTRLDSIIMFWDRSYHMFVAMWMASGNQGFLPEHVAGSAKGLLHPHRQHFKDAHLEMKEAQQVRGKITDKSVWTRVEQHFILAAAMELKLMGRGRSTTFVKKVFDETMVQTTVPVGWVGVNGRITARAGESVTRNTLPMIEALMRRWRNRIRSLFSKVSVAVQQEFQRLYCNPRGPMEPARFALEPAFESGQILWTNHASFKRVGTQRIGECPADINEPQAMFIAGTIWDDESFCDAEASPVEATLKGGSRQPGWLHSCVTVAADVDQHRRMSMTTDPITDFTVQEPYTLTYFECLMKYHKSINTVMFHHMWQQIDDGVEDVSKQQIDVNGMDKDQFDNKMQAIADTVVGRMLEAQAHGAVGSSQDREEEGILKTEWKAKRYKKHSERLTSKCNTQAEAQQRVRKWSAFYWWQPGGLALLDAFVAAIINTNQHSNPHFKHLFPQKSFKLARFVEVRTRFHRDNWRLLAPALKKYVRKVLETRMEEQKQPSLAGKAGKGRLKVKKEEQDAGGPAGLGASDLRSQNSILSQRRECGGASICQHLRQRRRCKECGETSICQHLRIRSQCKTCKADKDDSMPPDLEELDI